MSRRFTHGESREWLEKFYSLNDNWQAEDRRKLLAFARDRLNSDYAGHRLTFVQFAQAPHFNHLNAVYNTFDLSGPLDFRQTRRRTVRPDRRGLISGRALAP